MSEVFRLLLTLAMAGVLLTVLCGGIIWYMEEERRILRALKHVLGATPEAVVVARGRGRGAGFSFASGMAGVAWDHGAWCLVYRIDELMGAELLVDGLVVARAFRGEPRRALDQISRDAGQVTLRLIFDDAQDPDFDLDLWIADEDEGKSKASPAKAEQEANRWMARAEAIFRRTLPPRTEPPMVEVPVAPAREPPPTAQELPAFSRSAGAPPWDEVVEEPVQDALVE